MSAIGKKEMHELIDLLGRVDLESSKRYRFQLGSRSKIVAIFLNHIREHGVQRFTPQERQALADELGGVSAEQKKLIQKNLTFLLRNENDENVIEKIQSIQQQLLRGESADFVLTVPGKPWTSSDVQQQYRRYQSSGIDHVAYLSKAENRHLVEPIRTLGAKWFGADGYLHSVLTFTFSWFQAIGGKEYAAVAIQCFEMYIQALVDKKELSYTLKGGIAFGSPPEKTVPITSRAQLWKLCLAFIVQFQSDSAVQNPSFIEPARASYTQWFGKNSPIAEARFIACFSALRAIYGEKVALEALRSFNDYIIRFLTKNSSHGEPDLDSLKFLTNDEKTAILLQFLLNFQGKEVVRRKVQWGEQKIGSVEPSERKAENPSKTNDPILNQAQENIFYLDTLKQFYARFANPENIENLIYVSQLNVNQEGKSEFVKIRRPEAQVRFYEWAQREIIQIKEEQKLGSLREAAQIFMTRCQREWGSLDFPKSFYGEPLSERQHYAADRHMAQFDLCMRADEEWLKNRYAELKGDRPHLTDEGLLQLRAEIDALEQEGQNIVNESKERYARVLNLFRKEIIPKVLELRYVSTTTLEGIPKEEAAGGWLFENIKQMMGGIREGFHQQAAAIRQNPMLSSEEKEAQLESLAEDERILESIALQVMKQSREIQDPDVLFAAVLQKLAGGPQGASADFVIEAEVPLHFPERLRPYLEEYHKQQKA